MKKNYTAVSSERLSNPAWIPLPRLALHPVYWLVTDRPVETMRIVVS